ncbi:MAG: Rrf2 family transcriptional regulator [Syntrophobacteraceae bacterium]|nr:Rrf2 family transcriptional regulator [Desulfobacteraceae bacterium]
MKLSTRSRYGTRLMLDMAEHYNQGPIQLGTIAKRQNIPVKYLEQIIIPLKKANYVKSVRGNRGGHMLARPPEAITVGEIVELMEGGLRLTACTRDPDVCERSGTCRAHLLWKEVTDAMRRQLNALTLADVLKTGAPGGACPGGGAGTGGAAASMDETGRTEE